MVTLRGLVLLLGVAVSGLFFSALARAECGSTTQCIGVGATPADALVAHHGGPDTFTLAFGGQATGTASAARIIFVAAVAGPSGTRVVLGPITLSGGNPAEFSITGGTCASDGPVHGGAPCTITVTFNPVTAGPKSATVNVPLNPPSFAGALTSRTVSLTGSGGGGPEAGRTDPAKDANLVGLVRAQAQTVRRFSRAQILNYQRRMESLHLGVGAIDPPTADRTEPALGRSAGLDPEPGPVFQAASFVPVLVSAATTRSVNLSLSGERFDGSSGLPGGTGIWIEGNVNFGTRNQTSESSSFRFTTDGISVGADRRLSDKLTLGLGLGYARDKTDIGTDGTRSESSGTSLAVYGSYQPTANTFVDGLIGYGALRHDMDRHVASVDELARARRKSDQLFGSIAAGYEHRRDGSLLSPYGRLDFAIDRLMQVTETGAGLNALTYFDQNLPTLQFSLGLRAESRHETNFGWALPRLRVELKHDFKGDRQATIAFADQSAGPRFSVAPAEANRGSVLIGLGSDFIFRSGLKFGIDYLVQRYSRPDNSSHAVRLWLAKDLDGKGLPTGRSHSGLFEDPVRVEAGYLWDDNLTRAREASDKLSDNIYSINVSKDLIFPVTSHTRMVVSGFLNGEKLHTYRGLDRFSGGVQGEYQYRTSGDFGAPTFGIFGRASFDEYDSRLRTGYRYSLGVTARQSLSDRIDAFGALTSNARHAKSEVFDAREYGARFNFDYSLGRDGTVYLGGEYRRGDTVSTGRPSLASIALAKVFVLDDAFGTSLLSSYRFEAKTVLWTLGYNWPLGQRDSIDFSWRRARSIPTRQPDDLAGGASSYTTNQYSIAYLMRF